MIRGLRLVVLIKLWMLLHLWKPLSTNLFRPVASFSLPRRLGTARTTSSRLAMSSSSSNASPTKTVLVPIADGSEEIETACIQDVLVRFGADVTVASVKPDGNLLCTMSRGLLVQAHCSLQKDIVEAQRTFDLIVLPGGMPGAEHLRDCVPLTQLLQQHAAAGRTTGAVCAAPAVVLASQGLIPDDTAATSFPVDKFRNALPKQSDERVEIAHSIITSQGPGTSLEFALALGERLFGREKRDEIAQQLLIKE